MAKDRPNTGEAKGAAAAAASAADPVEALACDIFARLVIADSFHVQLRHNAQRAIDAARDFYKVWNTPQESER